MVRFSTPMPMRRGGRVLALVLSASTIVCGVAGTAMAGDDGGIFSFFSQQQEAPRVDYAPAPLAAPPSDTPALTIRKSPRHRVEFRHRKAPVLARAVAPQPSAQASGRPVRVSIYEDPTLRRGDAVMTEHGLRIFLGSRSFPYQAQDFRTIGAGSGISEQYRKALMEIDQRVPSAG